MKLTTALKSRTVWCGIIATAIVGLKLLWPESAALDDAMAQKNVMASQAVLIVEGLLGLGVILFRIKAKDRQ